jgi:predicted site-specific integrase-resolvase
VKILLREWAARRYDPVPSNFTLRRWAREGEIVPAPELVGKHYYVDEKAVRINSAPPTLLERIRAGE